jgi:calcineurin-like phosphoesterase family protein
MKYHFTSDIHFYHKNIIKFCNRPFASVEEMNVTLINNWNKVVMPEDIVWQLGDFSFANIEKTESVLRQLNGQKYAVLGNHDKEIIRNRGRLLDAGLFKEIVSYKELNIEGIQVNLFHYAGRTWNKSHHGAWQIFGHTHNDLEPYGRSVDVGVDSTYITGKAEYRPFCFEEIKRFMDKQPIIGHHDR